MSRKKKRDFPVKSRVLANMLAYRRLREIVEENFGLGTTPSRRASRVLLVDRLEKRDLLAVFTAMVFEDVNSSDGYDVGIDSPIAYQFVFADENDNQLFEDFEASAVSDEHGIFSLEIKDGFEGKLRFIQSLQGEALASEKQQSVLVGPKIFDLSSPTEVIAFDTILGEGADGWVSVTPSTDSEETKIPVGGELQIVLLPLPENSASRREVGQLLIDGKVPDPKWDWIVSDGRFEASEGKVYLRDHATLDFESEPKIELTIEAVNRSEAQDTGTENLFTKAIVSIGDENDPPSGIHILGKSVIEKMAGAIVGPVRVIDQDAYELYDFSVSDSRFTVVDGILRLKDREHVVRAEGSILDITITAQSRVMPDHETTVSAQIEVLPNLRPWHNLISPLDVNNDGMSSTLDALLIINHLNSRGSHRTDGVAITSPSSGRPRFLDVNGDGIVGPLDALIIINSLNRSREASAEGSGRE